MGIKDTFARWLLQDETRAFPTPETGLTLSSQFGGDQDRFSPREYGDYTAISNDFYTGAAIKMRALAKTPWVAYAGDEVQTAGPTVDVLGQPNPFWSGTLLKAFTSLSLSTFGEAYILIEPAGRRPNLWWSNPSRLSPIVDETEYITGFSYTVDNHTTMFPVDEVIWIRLPNVVDEFEPLSPLAAARQPADLARSASKANQNLFDRGLMPGGVVAPKDENEVWSEEQAKSVERDMDRRFRGVDKAHRWAVFRKQIMFDTVGITPRDMEFIDGQNLAFRQVMRALGVPAPLGGDGEFATLANLQVYERMLWEHTLEFETILISEAMSARLNADIRFDLSGVSALQEDETARWEREQAQLETGAITINEWREGQGKDTVPWGDAPWMPAMLIQPGGEAAPVDTEERGWFGSDEHRRALRIRDSMDQVEDQMARELEGLFVRQTDAVIQHLKQGARDAESAARDPFNVPLWVTRFREALRPRVTTANPGVVGCRGVADRTPTRNSS